jgi:hypothetical protein
MLGQRIKELKLLSSRFPSDPWNMTVIRAGINSEVELVDKFFP